MNEPNRYLLILNPGPDEDRFAIGRDEDGTLAAYETGQHGDYLGELSTVLSIRVRRLERGAEFVERMRMLLRAVEELAAQHGYDGLTTGEDGHGSTLGSVESCLARAIESPDEAYPELLTASQVLGALRWDLDSMLLLTHQRSYLVSGDLIPSHRQHCESFDGTVVLMSRSYAGKALAALPLGFSTCDGNLIIKRVK